MPHHLLALGYSSTAQQTYNDLINKRNAGGQLAISSPFLADGTTPNPQYKATLAGLLSTMNAAFLSLQSAINSQTTATNNNTSGVNNNTFAQSAAQLAGAQSGLTSYLQSSLLGPNSPLTPQQQYAQAQARFNTTLSAAQGGDLTAMGALGSTRDAFLAASRGVNGSNGQFNTDFFTSFNSTAALTAGAVGPLTGAQFAAMTQQVITAVNAAVTQGQAGTNAILTLINLIAHGVSVTDPLVLQALADVKALLRGNVKL